MKTPALLFGLLVLLAQPVPASANPDVEARTPDLVTAVAGDGRFATLAAALEAADLVDTLASEGPFTVFAPTNAAFEALPKGALASLLRHESKAELTRVLLAHVVKGRVLAADLVPAGAVKTLSGSRFPIGLRVGPATVTQTDILCSNGVVHVIDKVLLPTAKAEANSKAAPTATASAPTVDARQVIMAAIDKGVPLFNDGHIARCANLYAEAARTLVKSKNAVSDYARMDLQQALAHDRDDSRAYAWALREAFDRTVLDMEFTPRLEAPLPAGFPKPGPVGHVVKKRYPKYRAARASGGENGAFWRLLRHIKSNDVEMTAPVEMTMSDDMRMKNMAFLYEAPTQGQPGQQGQVRVLDLGSTEVLSIGMRGSRGADQLRVAKMLINKRMKDRGLHPTGPWRVMGYNSPMVPRSEQFWELQVPVAR